MLGRYVGGLHSAPSQVVAGRVESGRALLQGGHQTVEARVDAFLGGDGETPPASSQPVSYKPCIPEEHRIQ